VSLEEFLDSNDDGVFYIGHASALVRLGRRNILFDPVWDHKPYGEHWEFRPRQINCDEVLAHEVVVSHVHEDHVCENILREFAYVNVMAGRQTLVDRMKKCALTVYGFEPFEWVSSQHRPEIEYYFVPHAFNTVDSSCFVRSRKTGYTVYHGNDNFLSRELIAKIKPEISRVDVAMVPYAFIHWYPYCMEMPLVEKLSEINRLNTQSMNQAYDFVQAFSPKVTIPFGASLFHVENEFLNEHLSKPEDFKAAVPMRAGDYVIGEKVVIHPVKDEERDNTARLIAKIRKAETTVPGHKLIINDLVIDMEQLIVTAFKPATNYTEFKFYPVEFKKWFRGEITFEQAIGTRQFTCARVPNEYNLKVFEWMNRWL
jgi:L-ascorbate metabolism protein UlaG (beta-lactamase superfamily)